MSDISVPVRLQNAVGEWPDAEKWMADYDWLVAMLWGSFLLNGGNETWSGSTSFTNPANNTAINDNWTYTKSGTSAPTANVARESTIIDGGTYSTKVDITVAGSSDSFAGIQQSIQSIGLVAGYSMVFGAKVRAATGAKVRLKVTDGTTTAYSDYHSGDSTFQLLTVLIAVSASASAVTCSLEIIADFTGQIYWDSIFSYVVPASISAYARSTLSYQANRELTPAVTTASFLPSTDAAYDLGSSTKRFRDLWLSRAIKLVETGGGSDVVSIKAPSAVTASYDLIVPGSAPTANTQVLKVKDYTTGETEWGAGGGQGGINYITNYDAEANTTGWTAYADAAGTTPVDGTGGSPTTTWTRTTSSPLRGIGSFLLTKDAANRQGEGVGYAFTIDSADQARVLTISADILSSSAYVAADVTAWIYDVTNSALIAVAGGSIPKADGGTMWTGVFQAASNSTSYRLILHVATTNASAYTLKVDNVKLGPQVVQYGAPITDWQAYTPTCTGFGTVSSVAFFWARVGDAIHIKGRFTCGTPTAVEAQVTYPSGVVSAGSDRLASIQAVGRAGKVGPVLAEQSKAYMTFGSDGSHSAAATKQLGNALTIGSGDPFHIIASVPVTGWGSTVQMSNDTDTRVVVMSATIPGSQTISNNTQTTVAWSTVDFDSHGALNTGTGVYTVPVSGYYRVNFGILWTGNATGSRETYVVKNGTTVRTPASVTAPPVGANNYVVSGEVVVKCVAGDLLRIDVLQVSGGNLVLNGSANYTFLNIERISGPSAIAATETVAIKYADNSGPTIGTSFTAVTFTTKATDTHGAYASGVFTAPVSGLYMISVRVTFTFSASSTNSNIYLILRKNSSTHEMAFWGNEVANVTHSRPLAIVTVVKLLAGETIDFGVQREAAGTASLASGTDRSALSIVRIGNYA